jgi:hypothetical protein
MVNVALKVSMSKMFCSVHYGVPLEATDENVIPMLGFGAVLFVLPAYSSGWEVQVYGYQI